MKDSLIQYSEVNIIEKAEPILSSASRVGNTYTVGIGGSVKFELVGDEIKKSAKNILFDYTTNMQDNYDKKVGLNIYFVYDYGTSTFDKYTLNIIGFEATAGGFVGGNEINTRGYSFSSIIIEIFNNSASTLVLKDFCVYKSIDLQPDQLVDVKVDAVVSIETLMAKSAWVENMQVEVLETNTRAKSVKWGSASARDYIKIKENSITLGLEDLIETEFEQLHIEINGVATPVWYTAINENKQAYKYVTINHPKEYLPEITDEEALNYAYMVYKSKGTQEKMKIEIIDGNPRITFGVGTVGGSSMLGKGVMQKDKDVLKIEKYSNTENVISTGIYMRDNGSYMKGFDTLPTKVEISYNHINVVKADGTSIGFNVITDSAGNIKALESSTGKIIQFVVNM